MSKRKKDQVLEGLLHHTLKFLLKILEPKPLTSDILGFFFCIAGLLTYPAEVIVRIFFRRRTFLSVIDFIFALIGVVALIGFALYFFDQADQIQPDFGTPDICLAFGILYLVLSLFILIKSFKLIANRSHINEESIFIFKRDKLLNHEKISNIRVPLFLLILGSICFLLNAVAAIPLGACSVAAWVHWLMEKILNKEMIPDDVISIKTKINKSDDFTQVQS